MHLRNGPIVSTLIPLWQPLQRLHLVGTGGCLYIFIQINIEVPDWSVIIVSGGWEGRLEGGLMMIREKWELVMPSAQVKVEGSGMRPFLFGTRPSELEEQILRSARDRGWETTRSLIHLFMGMWNDKITLGKGLLISYKTKHTRLPREHSLEMR